MKIQIKLLAFLALVLLSSKSYSQSITITPAITQQSNTFKNLAGQDRKAAFQPLQQLFVTVGKNNTCAGVAAITFSDRAEVLNLLGTPNAVLSPNLVVYNLGSGSNTCRVEVGIDNGNRVLFIVINNCP